MQPNIKYIMKKNPGLPRPFLNMFIILLEQLLSYNFGSYIF